MVSLGHWDFIALLSSQHPKRHIFDMRNKFVEEVLQERGSGFTPRSLKNDFAVSLEAKETGPGPVFSLLLGRKKDVSPDRQAWPSRQESSGDCRS